MQQRSGLAAILASFRMVGVVALVLDLLRDEHPGKDRLSAGVGNLPIGFEVGSDVLPHGEGNVRVTEPKWTASP